MRWSTHLACGALLAFAAVTGSAADAGSEPASWRDLDGRAHQATLEGGKGATVLVFGSTECPCADRYTGRVKELAGTYAGKPVRFYVVFASEGETAAKVRGYASRRGINLPLVLDEGSRLATRMGADATPTAVVLDAAGAVRYSGRIDDSADPRLVRRAYVREALDALLQGNPVRQARTQVAGCAIQAAKPAAEERPPVRLMPGLGEVRFRPTTRVPEADRFFRQGLALWYGFNFDEAERSFREAARLDPECASAYWGTALSLGMNYNWDFDPSREAEVYQLVRKAVALSKNASERERQLIHALSLRHTDQPNPDSQKLLESYAAEMRRLHEAHPEDSDLAVLYAASAMDLRPWQLWTADGKPQPGTLDVIASLEKVLARDPDHIGAHHLLIHATEAGPNPERGLKSAERLATLAPKSGHLVHMPAHIYQRLGDFRNAAKHNRDAADVDAAYAKEKLPGRYVAYYIHNLDFLAYSHSMGGRAQDALATARELSEVIAAHRPKIRSAVCPSAPLVVADLLVRFQRWDDILRASEPVKEDLSGRLFDVYARGMAHVAKGDLEAAETALKVIDDSEKAATENFATTVAGTPYAKAGPLLIRTARSMLAAKIALARNDLPTAERHLRAGIEAEDQLPYAEPAMWRSPLREALGGALLRAGKAEEAEAVFREDLQRNRGNGRSLFGLWKSLERQGKTTQAADAERQFNKAWENADVRLTEGML